MLLRRFWKNGLLGGTPLEKDALNSLEADVGASLLQLAANPSMLFSGPVTRDSDGAPISATIRWPDGTVGVYSGTASEDFPGAVDSYQVTYAGATTITITQPSVTRNTDGEVTNSPALIIA
jgi:hypothetical protein